MNLSSARLFNSFLLVATLGLVCPISAPASDLAAIHARVKNLEAHLNQSLVGQQNAKSLMAQSAANYLVDRDSTLKKPHSILLYGEEGAGKTTLAKLTAESLGFKFKRILMGEYISESSAERFVAGLKTAVQEEPNTVFLFDGIEKANPVVQSILRRVLEEGRLGDTDLTKPLYVGATVAGGFLANQQHAPAVFDRVSEKEGLASELRNQFEASIPVAQPSLEEAFEILQLKTTELVKKLNMSGYSVSLDPSDVATAVIHRMVALAPRAQVSGAIGFGAPVGPKTIIDFPQITVPALEREIAAVELQIKSYAVNKKTKSIALIMSPKTHQLSLAEGKRDLVVLRCEDVFSRK